MAGSLTIPNTFATQSGNVPASELDDDYSAIADYVNDREITSGAFSSRPAAGISGRYYFANDVNGGTLYFDTGSTWVQIAAPVQSGAGYRITGLTGANNTGTPLSQYDLNAHQVQLWNPSDGGVVTQTNTGTITNNTSTAGPVANGRDQNSAFSSSSWVHFYFIYNGTLLRTLSSATAPPTGPTLPSGYTHWAYCGAVRFNGSSQLVSTQMNGSQMQYRVGQLVLNTGNATTPTSVDVSAAVPPNALSMDLQLTADVTYNAAVDAAQDLFIENVSGSATFTFSKILLGLSATHIFTVANTTLRIANNAQAFFYAWNTVPTGGSGQEAFVRVTAFTVPNGDS